MKRFLRDLSNDERKTLIESNEKLSTELYEQTSDTAFEWIGEYLNGCPAQYSFRGYYDEFHLENDIHGFEEWFNGVMHDYCLFSDDDANIIRQFIKYAALIYRFDNEYINVRENDYRFVGEKALELGEEVEQIIYDRMEEEIRWSYKTDVLVEELDVWLDNWHNGAFIIDDDYSHVYEHVNGYYVKAHDEIVA